VELDPLVSPVLGVLLRRDLRDFDLPFVVPLVEPLLEFWPVALRLAVVPEFPFCPAAPV
jgi:hypothetical protein